MMSETNQNEYNLLNPVAPRACRGDGTGVRGNTERPQLNLSQSERKNQRFLFNGVTIVSKFISFIKKNQS